MKPKALLLFAILIGLCSCTSPEPAEPIAPAEPIEEIEEIVEVEEPAEQPTCEGDREYQDWLVDSRELVEPSETKKSARTYNIADLGLSFQISSEFDYVHVFLNDEGSISFENTNELGCTSYGDEITPSIRRGTGSTPEEYRTYEPDVTFSNFTASSFSEQYFGGNTFVVYEFMQAGEQYHSVFIECRTNCMDREVDGKGLIHDVLNTMEAQNKTLTEEYAEALLVKLAADSEYYDEEDLSIGDLNSEDYYGEINGPWDGSVFFTIFLRKNDTPILALDQRGCGPLCRQTLTFYTYEDGVWTDVSDVSDVFPSISEAELDQKTDEIMTILRENNEEESVNFIYNLPTSGTSIDLVDQYDVFRDDKIGTLYKFEWDWKAGTFSVEEVN